MWIVEQIKLRKKLLKVSRTALRQYREQVKGNTSTPKLEVRKKLTRNVLMTEEKNAWYKKDGRKIYNYGNLTIVVENEKVMLVHNERGKKTYFKKDKQLYAKLNKELHIKEN